MRLGCRLIVVGHEVVVMGGAAGPRLSGWVVLNHPSDRRKPRCYNPPQRSFDASGPLPARDACPGSLFNGLCRPFCGRTDTDDCY